MKAIEKKAMVSAIEKGIANGQTYEDFRTLVSDLVTNKATTGTEQSEALIQYTMLNDRRMRRWDKTLQFDEGTKQAILTSDTKMTWLVLTESWCGDAGHSLPVIHKIAALSKGITLRIILRDEHEVLMDHFLTHGGRSIPKLIAYDSQTKVVKYTWGPRPTTATALVTDYKRKFGTLDAAFKEDLQRWYNKDKGKSITRDLLELMLSYHS